MVSKRKGCYVLYKNKKKLTVTPGAAHTCSLTSFAILASVAFEK